MSPVLTKAVFELFPLQGNLVLTKTVFELFHLEMNLVLIEGGVQLFRLQVCTPSFQASCDVFFRTMFSN